MCNLKMTRTIWPVGQGAFYTECFQNGNTKFNVVYDCGSFAYGVDGRGTPKCLNNQIAAANLNQVDLLFVSHFHWDHINGIQRLMNNATNARTHLVMPSMSDNVKAYYFLSILIDSGLGDEIVASQANNENREQNPAIQTADFYRNLVWGNKESYDVTSVEESNHVKLIFDNEGNIEPVIAQGIITEEEIKNAIDNRQRIWTYSIVQFGKNDLDVEANIVINRINTINANFVDNLSNGVYDLFTKEVWKNVKRTYHRTDKSKANNNSLIVLSTPIFPFEKQSRIEKSICPICCNCCCIKCNRKKCPDCFKSIWPSALYTGDKENAVDLRLFSHQNHKLLYYFPAPLGLYQISHHGHNNDFNQQVYHHYPFHRTLAFCCYGKENMYHHPDFRLIKSYCEDGICTLAMDENSEPLVQKIDLE